VKSATDSTVTWGSGDVFADLGFSPTQSRSLQFAPR